VVSITTRPLYPRAKTPVPTEKAAGLAPESVYIIFGEEKISSSGWGTNSSNIFLYSEYERSRNPQSTSTSYADPPPRKPQNIGQSVVQRYRNLKIQAKRKWTAQQIQVQASR